MPFQILKYLQKIYNDSIYGFHRPAATTYGPTNSPGPSRQQHSEQKKVDKKKNHKLRAELFASDAKLVLPHYFYYDTVLLYF